MDIFLKPKKSIYILSLLILFICSGAYAKEKISNDNNEIEVITVTARHGQEFAKDLPFGLNVLSQEQIIDRSLFSIKEALRSTPGVNVFSSGGAVGANIRIRGVGSLLQANKDDGSVVMNIDGVSMPAENVSLGTLDIQRMEILKGPQGTLYGRNSEAGAINITTVRPTDSFEGHAKIEMVSEDSKKILETVLSGPLSESLSARLAIRGTDEEHWVKNNANDKPLSKPETMAFRGSLLWDITMDTSALLIAERHRQDKFVVLQLLRPYGDNPADSYTVGAFDDNKKTIERLSLEVNHQLQNSQITSITSLVNTNFEYVTGLGNDASQVAFAQFPMFGLPIPDEAYKGEQQEQRSLSQDIRLSSLSESSTFWVVGLHLSDTKRSLDSQLPMQVAEEQRDYESNILGLYGEVTMPIAESLKLTAGGRFNRERKDLTAEYQSFNMMAGNMAIINDIGKIEDNYQTGRLALGYEVTNSSNVYALYSRGYKAGGFNDNSTDLLSGAPYGAAKINTFEIGFKHHIANLKINTAIFKNLVNDDHTLSFDGSTFQTSVINVDTEILGAEFESILELNNNFNVSIGLSYLDTEIKDTIVTASGVIEKGNELPDVPSFSTNMSFNYDKSLSDFMGLNTPKLKISMNYLDVGKRPANAEHSFDLDSYKKLDLRIAVKTKQVSLYVWADNLLDEEYELYGANFNGAFTGAPAKGRRIGFGAMYNF